MKASQLEIVAPDGPVFDEEAVQLSVVGTEGSLSILCGHMPFVTSVKAGEVRVYMPDGIIRNGTCGGGFLTVSAEKTRLLVGTFTWKE